MFNLQGSELVIILLLALVVLGPEKLPEAMRRFGQFYGELKKMSTGFQKEFRAAVDEPVRELRETADLLRDSADFRSLRDGERAEKPKTAEMGPVTESSPGTTRSPADLAPADPAATPSDQLPSFETPADADAPEPVAGPARPGPFSGAEVGGAAERPAAPSDAAPAVATSRRAGPFSGAEVGPSHPGGGTRVGDGGDGHDGERPERAG